MNSFDFASLVPAVPLAPADVEAELRQERLIESREVRDRLPPFLRHADRSALEGRVTGAGLLAAALAWRWGAGSLLLLGPTRCGKSTVAAHMYRRLLAEAVRAGGAAWTGAHGMAWFGAEELFAAGRAHPLGKGDVPETVAAERATLLFLDDAGWDRDPAPVSAVLNARYERQAPTVITSGKTPDELTAHYGAAVVRRMVESGGKPAKVVNCFPVTP